MSCVLSRVYSSWYFPFLKLSPVQEGKVSEKDTGRLYKLSTTLFNKYGNAILLGESVNGSQLSADLSTPFACQGIYASS